MWTELSATSCVHVHVHACIQFAFAYADTCRRQHPHALFSYSCPTDTMSSQWEPHESMSVKRACHTKETFLFLIYYYWLLNASIRSFIKQIPVEVLKLLFLGELAALIRNDDCCNVLEMGASTPNHQRSNWIALSHLQCLRKQTRFNKTQLRI